jgi:hypothetical protein
VTTLTIAICMAASLLAVAHAQADAGMYIMRLDFGKAPRLLPVLHAKQNLDGAQETRQYDYSAKGYFKIANKTVARLPEFTGHATQSLKPISLDIKRATRHTIRAIAKRRHAKHVILTLVYRLKLTNPTPGDGTPTLQKDTQDISLTI